MNILYLWLRLFPCLVISRFGFWEQVHKKWGVRWLQQQKGRGHKKVNIKTDTKNILWSLAGWGTVVEVGFWQNGSETRSIFCRGPNWPRFCSSGAPLPPSPLLLLLNSPIFEKSDGKLFDQSEPLRAADSLSQPWTRHGEFSIFSTQIFGLNIFELEGFLQRNYLQDFSVQQQQCTWNVFGREAKIWGNFSKFQGELLI